MIFSIKDAPAKDSPIRPSDDRQKILAADNSFRGADYDYLGYLDDFLNYYDDDDHQDFVQGCDFMLDFDDDESW